MGQPKPSKLKRGWKRDADGNPVSPEEWKARYCIRAIVIPVASPTEHGKGSPEAWRDLRESLRQAWIRSTEAANWALRRLLANEVIRQPGDTKCPKMPKIYLYGERKWDGWSQSAAAVLRTVESNYRSKRYQVVWTGGASLPNVRYPYPYPVHNAAWDLFEHPEGGLFFECRLPDGRVSMRLKGGHEYRRQLLGARWLIENPHLRGEASIYQCGDQIVVKLVGWFPRKVDQQADGVMYVRTDPQSFLIGLNAKDERLWIINGDRARRWMTRTAVATQRWREDQKYEMRHPKRKNRKTAEDMQAATKKNRDRLSSFIDESAAQVVNHARRRRLSRIVLDDSCREFFRDFQWFRLHTLMAQKANAAGIEFERSRAATEADTARNTVSQDGET